jgi:hypothetical protein
VQELDRSDLVTMALESYLASWRPRPHA